MLFARIFHFHSQISLLQYIASKSTHQKGRKFHHLTPFFVLIFYFDLVVSQYYDTDVNKAYVIRGNAGILKCEIPSFVADFVSVESWHTDQDETFYPGTDYGLWNWRNIGIACLYCGFSNGFPFFTSNKRTPFFPIVSKIAIEHDFYWVFVFKKFRRNFFFCELGKINWSIEWRLKISKLFAVINHFYEAEVVSEYVIKVFYSCWRNVGTKINLKFSI